MTTKLADLPETLRREANARDDGTGGHTARSTGAWHLRWCADRLDAALAKLQRQVEALPQDRGELREHGAPWVPLERVLALLRPTKETP